MRLKKRHTDSARYWPQTTDPKCYTRLALSPGPDPTPRPQTRPDQTRPDQKYECLRWRNHPPPFGIMEERLGDIQSEARGPKAKGPPYTSLG